MTVRCGRRPKRITRSPARFAYAAYRADGQLAGDRRVRPRARRRGRRAPSTRGHRRRRSGHRRGARLRHVRVGRPARRPSCRAPGRGRVPDARGRSGRTGSGRRRRAGPGVHRTSRAAEHARCWRSACATSTITRDRHVRAVRLRTRTGPGLVPRTATSNCSRYGCRCRRRPMAARCADALHASMLHGLAAEPDGLRRSPRCSAATSSSGDGQPAAWRSSSLIVVVAEDEPASRGPRRSPSRA